MSTQKKSLINKIVDSCVTKFKADCGNRVKLDTGNALLSMQRWPGWREKACVPPSEVIIGHWVQHPATSWVHHRLPTENVALAYLWAHVYAGNRVCVCSWSHLWGDCRTLSMRSSRAPVTVTTSTNHSVFIRWDTCWGLSTALGAAELFHRDHVRQSNTAMATVPGVCRVPWLHYLTETSPKWCHRDESIPESPMRKMRLRDMHSQVAGDKNQDSHLSLYHMK